MAERVTTIRKERLEWAFNRAGFDRKDAVVAFPALDGWLSGKRFPTIHQLELFAQKFHVPFGYLFLKEIPQENIPFPMFRGKAGLYNHFDLNVYDTVMGVRDRQEWLEEYLIDNELETCRLVGMVCPNTPIEKTVSLLRDALGLKMDWAYRQKTTEDALRTLTQQFEQAGIFVSYNGVVGNNTHRALAVSECRGFALANEVAPYIFVNNADSKVAQMFTLIHEAVHLMLGQSAGHAGEDTESHDAVEKYCDAAAAEFLVPASLLKMSWNGDVSLFARRFKVSEIVIARRAHTLGLLTTQQYQDFWTAYNQRPPVILKEKGKGGDFYRTTTKRIGKLFAIHVRNAVNSRQLSYTEAYRLTGLYGKTYQQFMNRNI